MGTIADQDVVLDEHVVANVAVAAYRRVGQDVGERPDACAGADFGRLAYAVGVNEIVSWHRVSRGSGVGSLFLVLLFFIEIQS